MMPKGTLILAREEIQKLMRFEEYVAAVQEAFRLHAEGRSLSPGVLDVKAPDGTFHIKAAGLELYEQVYIAAKVNGNFPDNRTRHGLPTIQGSIVLCDGGNGYPLAFLDSTEITSQRTAAATAVAARRLARAGSRVATICGCGIQGRVQLTALLSSLQLQQIYAFDSDPHAAMNFAREMTENTGVEVAPVSTPAEGAMKSDVIVTCTTSIHYFLRREDVRSGSFVAAVGADSHEKQELDPYLLAANKVVTDILEQCAVMGDLHHAIRQGLMTRENVHAELGQIVAGRRPGRTSEEETIIFDSTGTAIQDVAAAAAVYRKALDSRTGYVCKLL